MKLTASRTPASCLELRKAERKVVNPRQITFHGVDGYDVYNISTPFTCEGRHYIAGRVEKRDTEFSVVRIFEKTGEDEYTAILPEMTCRNYDAEQVEQEYRRVSDQLTALQLTLDRANLLLEFEVELEG